MKFATIYFLVTTALLAALLTALFGVKNSVHAAEVGGIKYADEIQLDGTKLVLNGAGIRYKALFKVYAAGVYATKKTQNPEDLYKGLAPRRIQLVALRDLRSDEIGRLFIAGIKANSSEAETNKILADILRFGQIFSEAPQIKNRETFGIDWNPRTGMQVMLKGKPLGEPFKNPDFFNAIVRIWLGQSPADPLLKDALLGQPYNR